jgi:hypothetical protein
MSRERIHSTLRQAWIILLVVLVNSGLWMDALHHHSDFSRDNPDCIFCQAAGSPAITVTNLVVPQAYFHIVQQAAPRQFGSRVIRSHRVLLHSPKTGPPSPAFLSVKNSF